MSQSCTIFWKKKEKGEKEIKIKTFSHSVAFSQLFNTNLLLIIILIAIKLKVTDIEEYEKTSQSKRRD